MSSDVPGVRIPFQALRCQRQVQVHWTPCERRSSTEGVEREERLRRSSRQVSKTSSLTTDLQCLLRTPPATRSVEPHVFSVLARRRALVHLCPRSQSFYYDVGVQDAVGRSGLPSTHVRELGSRTGMGSLRRAGLGLTLFISVPVLRLPALPRSKDCGRRRDTQPGVSSRSPRPVDSEGEGVAGSSSVSYLTVPVGRVGLGRVGGLNITLQVRRGRSSTSL